jgi:hypothetical protein
MSLVYLQHKNINKARWDECISHAENSLIYAYSFYLDSIAPGWQALIDEEYNWALPLTSKSKFGIGYLYQPNFTQQLGVFFKKDTNVPWNEIIRWLQKKFLFFEVNWNYETPAHLLVNTIQYSTGTNFILNLSGSYNRIAAKYHNDLKKNLKQSGKFNLNYQPELAYEKSIDLYMQYYASRMPHVTTTHYNAFSLISKQAAYKNQLICRKITNNKNETLAIALLLKDNKRLYNLMNTTTNEGRRTHANHFLIDAIIKEFSNTNLILDFEGSDLAGVKSFYENFGAINQPYFKIKYNKLPWPLQLFKK